MIIICGKSGSGKTQLEKLLKEKHGLKRAKSVTTRRMRPGEVDGIDYDFKSKNLILDLAKKGELAELIVYKNEYYALERKECKQDNVVVMIPEGIEQVKSHTDLDIFVVYLRASIATRKRRMEERGDIEEDILERIGLDQEIFKNARQISDFVINNEQDGLNHLSKISDIVYKKYKEHLK